jgi:hypothetical protein
MRELHILYKAWRELNLLVEFLKNDDACCELCEGFGSCDETRARKTDVQGRTAYCAVVGCCTWEAEGNTCPSL